MLEVTELDLPGLRLPRGLPKGSAPAETGVSSSIALPPAKGSWPSSSLRWADCWPSALAGEREGMIAVTTVRLWRKGLSEC